MVKEVKKEDKQKYTFNLLIENSVTLQRILTEVAINLKVLNEKLDNLLNLFEEAAKTFKERKPESGARELVERLDEISNQNRTIAKGVMLLEQSVRSGSEGEEPQSTLKPKPLPELGI